MKKLFLFLGLVAFGFAEESCVACDPEPTVPISALVIVDSDAPMVAKEVALQEGALVRGVALLERHPGFVQQLKRSYLGLPLTCGTLKALKEEVSHFYEKKNQLLTWVTIPKQSWEDGVVKVVVEEVRLGTIRPQGNTFFSGTELMHAIRTKSGDPIIAEDVMEDLAWLNQNPFRRTDAVWSPGKQKGIADLDLVTTDRWPYRIYTGSDNTGTISTQRPRIFGGFNFGKTIFPDSDASYQFTCSPNWNVFYAHTVSTRIGCPWRHTFVAFGAFSEVQPLLHPLDAGQRKEKGRSWQIDGRYRIPLMMNAGFMQELIIGYDFKETQLRMQEQAAGSSVWTTTHRTADINQFMLGYELGYATRCKKATLQVEVYGNPSGITRKNKTRFYEEFQAHAEARYVYLKASHSFAQKGGCGGWWSYDITGQLSSAHLLSSEQMTLSGYEGVRGFEERIANVDSGFIVNVEWESPRLSPTSWWGKKQDELYAILFFDCAGGDDHHNWQTLGSIGPALRYQYGRYVTARFDYGFQLWHSGFENPSHSRYNFGVIVSY